MAEYQKNKVLAKPTAISLFCGAGGCSLGFHDADYEILFANDKDTAAIKTYKRNFPKTKCSDDDINDIDFSKLATDLGLQSGDLDILIGGPPCQGFSTAGTKFWDDPRNHLLKSYIEALEVLKPKWFLMENVEGLLTSNKGKYVFETAAAFLKLGYDITIDKVYAQEYGIPQRRKRVLITGNRIGYKHQVPKAVIQASGQIFRNTNITLNHAIADLPYASTNTEGKMQLSKNEPSTELAKLLRNGAKDTTDHYSLSLNNLQLERISALKPGQTMKDLPERLQHESYKKRANRRVADGTPSEKRGGPPSGLKRLNYDEPCLTITGAATRELIHPTFHRPLTIREAARIQTFPDTFNFSGTAAQKIQQIGNAIPPQLAKIFAEHIKNKYGFTKLGKSSGELLGFNLTKAEAMSPALKRTTSLLQSLKKFENLPLNL